MSGLSDAVSSDWKGGYAWRPFAIKSTTREFRYSRRAIGSGQKAIPSNISAVWTPGFEESLIGGVLQGRKQFDPRGASAICRRKMWELAVRVAGVLGVVVLRGVLEAGTYDGVKEHGVFGERRRVKADVVAAGLQGWVRNTGDGGWGT